MALQTVDLDTLVRIPTDTENTETRLKFERAFEQGYTERDVSSQSRGIVLRWAEDLDTKMAYTCRLQDWRNRIYLEASPRREWANQSTSALPANWSRDLILWP